MLVLTLAGRLGRASASSLANAISGVVVHPNRRVVIDFHGVDYVSSAGVRALQEGLRLARLQQAVVVLTGLIEPVRLTLELAGLLSDVVAEPTREAAVKRLQQPTDT